jgi:PPOX class probable F420-dependent enzyme
MASLNDEAVMALLQAPNCAVISTHNGDGSILSAVAWIGLEDGVLAVNSAQGRRWPANLDRDGHVTALVYAADSPYEFVSIRGTAARATDGDDDDHIDRLARKYLGQDEYPFRQPGEQRIKYVITPDHVTYLKQ